MSLVLGVDGGNTKTVAVLADASGEVRGWGRSTSSDIYSRPPRDAVDEIWSAIDSALTTAEARADEIETATLSLAGADWEEDVDTIQELLAASGRPSLARLRIVPDAVGAVWSGSAEPIGVSIVCGTGPAVGAVGPEGRTWAAGWWLQLQAGAVGLGDATLTAAYHASLGVGPETRLLTGVLDEYGATSADELIRRQFRREGGADHVWRARAARTLLAHADTDPVAAEILRGAATALSRFALVAARTVGLDTNTQIPVVLSGSLLQHAGPAYPRAVLEALAAHLPGARATVATVPPVMGALQDAFRRATGTRDSSQFLDVARRTMPPEVAVRSQA